MQTYIKFNYSVQSHASIEPPAGHLQLDEDLKNTEVVIGLLQGDKYVILGTRRLTQRGMKHSSSLL